MAATSRLARAWAASAPPRSSAISAPARRPRSRPSRRKPACSDPRSTDRHMVSAWVVEILGDETHVARGLYGFVQLPTAGDRVMLPNERGSQDVAGVVQIENSPARVQADAPAAKEPRATAYVQWIAEWAAHTRERR